MTDSADPFAGQWEKISKAECSRLYPDLLQFDPNHLYRGFMNTGEFTVWDVGTYEIVDASRVRISTANDAILTYAFQFTADTLTFKDTSGCEFKYRKAT